jgi:hypothetical protein
LVEEKFRFSARIGTLAPMTPTIGFVTRYKIKPGPDSVAVKPSKTIVFVADMFLTYMAGPSSAAA